MTLIVYLALLASAVVAWRHGPGRALLTVYLPVLLLIPDAFHAQTPGHPKFAQAAIVPILLATVVRHRHRWKAAPMDVLILVFAAWVGYSDYSARGFADARSLMLAMLTSVIAPYVVARLLIDSEGLHVAVARRFVIIVFAVVLVDVWEFRFGFNPFITYGSIFFPGQASGWVTTFRHGVARVAGPYSHAILAGIMVAVAYRLQRWLQGAGHWEPRFARVPWPKAAVITSALFVGLLMTVARGPWLGALVGAAIAAVGRARNPRRALAVAAVMVLLAAVAGGLAMAAYLDIRPGSAMTASQESAMYRKVLFERYVDIAIDHAWFGWGVTDWPKVGGMESIDNYYLLLALMHGLPATLMLLLMLLGSTALCIRRGLAEPPGSHSLAYAFAGIFITIFVALGTVYLGEQVLPTLFFMLGWAQGWLQGSGVATAKSAMQPATGLAFRRVIC